MKQFLKTTIFLLLALILPTTANAYSFKVNGIYYDITGNNTASVTYQSYSNGTYTSDYSGSVTIPSTVTYGGTTYSVTTIGYSAFYNCSGLTSVTIPNSITSIGEMAFYGCTGLTSVYITSLESWCKISLDWESNPLSYANHLYLNGVEVKNLVIPSTITSIGSYAFSGCSSLTSVTIPNSVTSIGNYAFGGCSGLTSVTIPNSVTSIGNYAFGGCSGLTSVTIPNSVTEIGSYAFYGCSGLTSMTIPNSVTSIGGATFRGCSGLTSVTIPNSVTEIGSYAFYGCSGLTSLTIGNSVTTIDSYAFYGCSGLTSVNIPNSVTKIGGAAFRGCSGLTSVTIPNSVTSIGGGAFGFCSRLTDIIVESDNNVYDSREDCNAIIETTTNNLIVGCKSTIIPNSVTEIGSYAFYGCSGLTSLTIGNSVTTIDSYAFYGCSGLTSVNIPNSVTKIGGAAFSYCSDLTDIMVESDNTVYDSREDCNAIIETTTNNLIAGCKSTIIPNTVTEIGYHAFRGCSGLTSVTIPNSVTSIGSYAFYGCSGLNEVYSHIAKLSSVSMGINIFSGNPANYGNRTLYVPIGTLADYQADTEWCQYFGQIVEMELILVSSLELNMTSAEVIEGNMMQLMVTVLPSNATNKTVTWSTSNSNIATVNSNGLVTAIAPGTATITATTTDGTNLSASCAVTVRGNQINNDNYLTINNAEAFRGDTIVIPVAMTNAESIISFQTDIFLSNGLEIVQEDGDYLIDPSSRMTRTHSIMSNVLSNGAVRVLCYSSNYKPFTGNSGDDLFYITIKVANDAEGDYSIQLKNTLFTTSNFEELIAPDAAANVHVNAYLLGDANGSGTVTVTDVVVTSQYVLEQNPHPFIFEAADVNADNSITVTDVSRIAWMVLNPTQRAPLHAPALWNNFDRMSGDDITLMDGETRKVSIMLDNEMDYAAFQLDMNLPAGLTASNFELTDRAGSHAFDVNTLQSGNIRALCYSPAMKGINGHEGALLTFDVTATGIVNGNITVDGIELVTTGCQTVLLDGFAIGVNMSTNVNTVSSEKAIAHVDYFNMAGQQIDRPESGVTLVVTTYTDGTRTTTKIIK